MPFGPLCDDACRSGRPHGGGAGRRTAAARRAGSVNVYATCVPPIGHPVGRRRDVWVTADGAHRLQRLADARCKRDNQPMSIGFPGVWPMRLWWRRMDQSGVSPFLLCSGGQSEARLPTVFSVQNSACPPASENLLYYTYVIYTILLRLSGMQMDDFHPRGKDRSGCSRRWRACHCRRGRGARTARLPAYALAPPPRGRWWLAERGAASGHTVPPAPLLPIVVCFVSHWRRSPGSVAGPRGADHAPQHGAPARHPRHPPARHLRGCLRVGRGPAGCVARRAPCQRTREPARGGHPWRHPRARLGATGTRRRRRHHRRQGGRLPACR